MKKKVVPKKKTKQPVKPVGSKGKQTLTAKAIRFCNEYLIDMNATKAAQRAGYSFDTAYSIGPEVLKKPEVQAFISEKLKAAELSADEAVKLISDIARSNLSDYFVTKMIVRTQKVSRKLKDLIKDLEEEITFEAELAEEIGYDPEGEEEKAYLASQNWRRRTLAKWRLQLKKDPTATRIVDGPEELVASQELDLDKLVADKERGRIKSITPTPNGLKIELFSAEDATRDVLKMHGKFAKDNLQKAVQVNLQGAKVSFE